MKKKKVAIITNFTEFNPGYSLTGIVKDQARMLVEHGHDVILYVNERYNGVPVDGVTMRRAVPVHNLVDYGSLAEMSDEHVHQAHLFSSILVGDLQDTDIVFTHDAVFTGWMAPVGVACTLASARLPNIRWMHWIHSVAIGSRDYRDVGLFPQGHKLIYPNETDRSLIASTFQGRPDDVRVIPHIRDLRSYFDFGAESCSFIDDHPAIMQAEVVQVYPCSSDRLLAKRLNVVIELFGRLKQIGYSVCLVVANQWATGLQRREGLQPYLDLAEEQGLVLGRDFIVTSLWKKPEYETGVNKQLLRELMQCSNLFVFPTREESFGLVLAEAALASGALCVLNESLKMQLEVSAFNTMFFKFGSFSDPYFPENLDEFYWHVASRISAEMQHNQAIKFRTHVRRRYNYDALYHRYYAPTMAESEQW